MLEATALWWEQDGSRRKKHQRTTTERIFDELVALVGRETMVVDIDDEMASVPFRTIRDRPHLTDSSKVGLSNSAVKNGYALTLGGILRLMVHKEMLPDAPSMAAFLGREGVRTREPSEAELDQLAAILLSHAQHVAEILVETGLCGAGLRHRVGRRLSAHGGDQGCGEGELRRPLSGCSGPVLLPAPFFSSPLA